MAVDPSKQKSQKNTKYLLIRYGRMNSIGWFEHKELQISRTSSRVVIKTDKGLELGHLIGQCAGCKSGHFGLSKSQIKQYYANSGVDVPDRPAGRILRIATHDDISEEKHLATISKEEIQTCNRFASKMNIPMKVITAEHILGGERIVFYFMAENRIDFRELVKKLAHEYQTRIEMRQIGSRDEARLLGDYETCGQQCCCQRFLRALKPVNMRMAKVQKATLDPSKISGYCGRLKCCLRYEDELYSELKKRLPKKNTIVKFPGGEGRVINGQIMTQLVVLETEKGERVAVSVDEIEIISKPQSSRNRAPKENKENKEKSEPGKKTETDKPEDNGENPSSS